MKRYKSIYKEGVQDETWYIGLPKILKKAEILKELLLEFEKILIPNIHKLAEGIPLEVNYFEMSANIVGASISFTLGTSTSTKGESGAGIFEVYNELEKLHLKYFKIELKPIGDGSRYANIRFSAYRRS